VIDGSRDRVPRRYARREPGFVYAKKCDYVPRRVNIGTRESFIFEFNINRTSEFIILLFRMLNFLRT